MENDIPDTAIVQRATPPFAVVPAAALLDRRLTNAQRYVFCVMCLHANTQHFCWPKVETLADEMGITKQAVSKTIHQLVALGYVTIHRYGFPARNRYRITFDLTADTQLQPDVATVSQLQSQPHVDTDEMTSRVNLTLTKSQPHVDKQSTSEVDGIEHTNRTNQKNIVSHDDLLSSSLAPAAPPDRRTRERDFDDSALKRDPLTLALVACLGHEPATRREWGQWRIAVNDLHNIGVNADDLPRAIRGYQATYPRARVTPLALVGHWSEIQEGKPHDLAQLEINRRSSETAARQKAEREHADAERKAQEQREVQRLLREYGY